MSQHEVSLFRLDRSGIIFGVLSFIVVLFSLNSLFLGLVAGPLGVFGYSFVRTVQELVLSEG